MLLLETQEEATTLELLQLTISELKLQLDQPHPEDLVNANLQQRTSVMLVHQGQRELLDLQGLTEFQVSTESQDTTPWMLPQNHKILDSVHTAQEDHQELQDQTDIPDFVE